LCSMGIRRCGSSAKPDVKNRTIKKKQFLHSFMLDGVLLTKFGLIYSRVGAEPPEPHHNFNSKTEAT
jgi:hypothetical protein